MPESTLQLSVQGNRRKIRKQIIEVFLHENPGTGTGENTSKYKYEVEKLADGKKIFLKRPARLNKGFDFEVNVENTYFGTKRRVTLPSHRDIYDDLTAKKRENASEFEKVMGLVEKIYRCEEVPDREMRSLSFLTGYPVEMILKVIKWLFIEQDVTYWNWSGRNKFCSFLQEI